MKRFVVVLFCTFSLFGASICFCQEKQNNVILRVKVIALPESNYAKGVEPPESSSTVALFKILKVCDGIYTGREIKIAFRGGAERTLKIGDQVGIKATPTSNYRKAAEFLQMDLGVIIPEESIADFEFAGNEDSCRR